MLEIKDFKVIEEVTDWGERNILLGEAMKITGHEYFVVRTKTEHVGITRLAQIIEECKGNPKIFYWKLKQEKK